MRYQLLLLVLPHFAFHIVIDNVRIFDGETLQGLSSVVIDGDVIGDDATGATQRIDGEGGVLLPGFIDSHTHPNSMEHLESLTSHGVTTAFNMACYSAPLCNSMQHHPGLVEVHWGTTPATVLGSSVGNTILNVTSDESLLIHGEEDVERWAHQQASRGPEFFKMAAEPSGPSQEILDTVVQSAHRQGKQAICHAATQASQRQAHLSGADQIHHTPLDAAVDEQLALQVVAQGQVSVPTLSVMRRFAALFGANYAAARDSVKVYYDAAVPILVGTDANEETIASVAFGSSLHAELVLLAEAGMSNVQVLRSATAIPARHWGLDDRGVIAPGKRADLVLIRGNPLDNITETQNISRVWVRGIEYALKS
ncbi:amidohydrolase [Stachybotrys elegans]|uniref:Amidohydrolase n=1 Tax=Stachybotrys elegans TaxID=80388 RepID=A0A8K0SIR5_9HYPO|nr:amidohydrolase [Stachybotrys elegans]